MDYPNNDHIAQVCERHNQPIVFYEQVNNKPNCLVCLQEKTGMIQAETYQQTLKEIINKEKTVMNPAETNQQKLKEIINKEKLNYINNKQLYQNIYNLILNYKNNLIQSLDEILQMIQDQMQRIDWHQSIIQKYIEQNRQQSSIEAIEKKSQQQQLDNEQFKNQIKQLLDEHQKEYLTSLQLIINFDKKQKIVIKEQIIDWNKVECEIIKYSSKKESQVCYAFAFNNENTILVVGCKKEIIIYQFINGAIAQELQRLIDHTYYVTCLYFMQQSNSFVSGSGDCSIIIWEFDNSKNQWFAKQKLQENRNIVDCILMNSNEELLISGSRDKTIKFWKKIQNNWECQQTIDINGSVYAISLNEMENKLISCGQDKFISIMEKDNDDHWRIVQTLNVNRKRVRLCFTEEDQFVFQLSEGDQLEIYSYDTRKKQFQISQKVEINKQYDSQKYFPCQYIKQLKMISVKHGKYLNIFKINQAGDYQLKQSIEFQSNQLFGRLTDDGQILITWDSESKEIQVRKLIFLQ